MPTRNAEPLTELQKSLRAAMQIVDTELPLAGRYQATAHQIADRQALRREAFRQILGELLDNEWVQVPLLPPQAEAPSVRQGLEDVEPS